MASKSEDLSFEIPDPPYQNFFVANQDVSIQVILASPLRVDKSDNKSSHRLLFAWPAGNSGAVLYFKPSDAKDSNGLKLSLHSQSPGRYLDPLVQIIESDAQGASKHAGITAELHFSHPATLDVAVLGSLRTIRDYTEGGGLLNKAVQDGIRSAAAENGAQLTRTWFDGRTTTKVHFEPLQPDAKVDASQQNMTFSAGTYRVHATVNYPHSSFLPPAELLRPECYGLIDRYPKEVASLAFLMTREKFLAGAWRFFTYFGRDTLITLLLMEEILAPEAVEIG